jgi:hypothetical protein
MRTKIMIKSRKAIMLFLVIGFALVVLSGCGIGHGPYRYGYDGVYPGADSGDDYRNRGSYGAMYGPDNRVYNRHMPGYGDGIGRYCGW